LRATSAFASSGSAISVSSAHASHRPLHAPHPPLVPPELRCGRHHRGRRARCRGMGREAQLHRRGGLRGSDPRPASHGMRCPPRAGPWLADPAPMLAAPLHRIGSLRQRMRLIPERGRAPRRSRPSPARPRAGGAPEAAARYAANHRGAPRSTCRPRHARKACCRGSDGRGQDGLRTRRNRHSLAGACRCTIRDSRCRGNYPTPSDPSSKRPHSVPRMSGASSSSSVSTPLALPPLIRRSTGRVRAGADSPKSESCSGSW